MMNRKGTGNAGDTIQAITYGIMFLVMLIFAMNSVLPQAQTSGNTLNTSTSLPLRVLFSGSGVVFVLIMVAIVLSLITGALNLSKIVGDRK